jgi:hypothetical protein
VPYNLPQPKVISFPEKILMPIRIGMMQSNQEVEHESGQGN